MGPHVAAYDGATAISQHDTSPGRSISRTQLECPGQNAVYDEMERLAADGQRGRFDKRCCGVTVYSFGEKIS